MRRKHAALGENIRIRLHTRTFQSGIRIALLAFAAIAVVIGINLAVSALPENLSKWDTTPSALIPFRRKRKACWRLLRKRSPLPALLRPGSRMPRFRKCLTGMPA